MPGKSIRDLIHDEHFSAGRTKGSLADRERLRLLAKTGQSAKLSLAGLYRAANENNRLIGRYAPR